MAMEQNRFEKICESLVEVQSRVKGHPQPNPERIRIVPLPREQVCDHCQQRVENLRVHYSLRVIDGVRVWRRDCQTCGLKEPVFHPFRNQTNK